MRRSHVKIPLVFGAVLILIFALSIGASASHLGTESTSPDAVISSVLINEFIATPSDSEAVEICNTTDAEIDISGWTMDGATINAGVVVPANGYVVLDDNNTSGIGISNAGEVLELVDDGGVTIDLVGYGDDGGAPKPEYSFSTARVPDCATTGDDGIDWNTDESPTLGAANDGPAANLGGSTVTINEVDPNNGVAFIELYNSGDTAVDLSDWRISVDDSYDIPTGQSIPAGGFWVLDEADFPGFFSLGASKDNVYLFNAALERVDQVGWDAAPGSSWNRLPDGAGANDGYQQAHTPLTAQDPTKNASNAPATPVFIINETATITEPTYPKISSQFIIFLNF